MSWGHVVRLIGGIVVMVMVPLPYYIRVLVFYLYEESEVGERRRAIERLNLKVCHIHLISSLSMIQKII